MPTHLENSVYSKNNNMRLEDDYYCFACGSMNEAGLKLRFQLDNEKKIISTEWTPQKIHQGFKEIVHGGIIGLILDECSVNLAWKLGVHAVSAEYTVKLTAPAKVGKKLLFSATLLSEKTKLLVIKGECRDTEGKKIAASITKCVKV